MRLHRIEVENLSSLYGAHTVDLDVDLQGAPLFVIVGPTGAGKSTVLDAVSLALFGETPRLDNSRGRDKGDDVDSRHIMSRGTGSCRAVVDFSRAEADGARTRYRASWSCHRANKLADGAFQTAKRSLELALPDGGWELLVDDPRRKIYEPFFERALDGLTVQDFQRSILLAQGEFTALLRASPDEKASILERLTSTEVYADLGRRANAMRRTATVAFELADARLKALNVLGPDALRELERGRDAAAARRDEVRRRVEQLEAEATWLTRDETLAHAADDGEAALVTALAERDAAAPSLERLAEDARCRPAGALAEAARRDAGELAELTARGAALASAIGALDGRLATAQAHESTARAALAVAVAARREAAPAVAEARRLREAGRHAQELAATATAAARRASGEVAETEARREQAATVLAAAAVGLERLAERLVALAPARELPSALSGLEARAARLRDEDRRATELAAEAEAEAAELARLDAALTERRVAWVAAAATLAALGGQQPTAAEAAGQQPTAAEAVGQQPTAAEAVERELEAVAVRLGALAEAGRARANRDAERERLAASEAELDGLLAGLEAAREQAALDRVAPGRPGASGTSWRGGSTIWRWRCPSSTTGTGSSPRRRARCAGVWSIRTGPIRSSGRGTPSCARATRRSRRTRASGRGRHSGPSRRCWRGRRRSRATRGWASGSRARSTGSGRRSGAARGAWPSSRGARGWSRRRRSRPRRGG